MRTSKSVVILRSCVVVFLIYLPLSWIWNSMTQTNYWNPSEMAIAAVLSVLLYGGFAWLITNFGMGLVFGRNAKYRAYRNSGGDPFFDSLPRMFNPHSEHDQETGMPEPDIDFVPHESWQFRCPQCNARVQHRIDVCWHCNYGVDNDSTSYFDLYGDARPLEISEEQWAEIQAGCQNQVPVVVTPRSDL